MEFEGLKSIDIKKEWINWYREEHKSRAFETSLKGGLKKPRHPHLNHPYCNLCDEDIQESETCFILYVGGHLVPYHVSCITANRNTLKVKNIISQDRSFREKHAIKDKPDTGSLRIQFYEYFIGLLTHPQTTEDQLELVII
jgi:hypothetical protein